jgi:hypothetical protein
LELETHCVDLERSLSGITDQLGMNLNWGSHGQVPSNR